jgi:hypothetical protein
MEITKSNKSGQFKLTIFDYADSTLIISMQDSINLNKNDLNIFFSALGKIDLLKIKTNNNQGLDGIEVRNFVSDKSSRNEFYFWSPNKGSQEHRIVEALLELSRAAFTDIKHIEYFESLEQYFDFGLPCKIVNKDPWEARIYGVLSVDDESTRALTEFLNSLPSDRPILIDMTNFQGMGTLFYPLFKELITRNKNIVWAAENNEQLLEIGVDKDRIVSDVSQGKKMIE